jgi:hypothetical protein
VSVELSDGLVEAPVRRRTTLLGQGKVLGQIDALLLADLKRAIVGRLEGDAKKQAASE